MLKGHHIYFEFKKSSYTKSLTEDNSCNIPDRYRTTIGTNAKHQVSFELTATIHHLLYL